MGLLTKKTEDSLTPDASHWCSSASYDHVEDLTASELAWEWLRRNDVYDRDFEALTRTDTDPQSLTDKIRQRWGVRFPRGPSPRPTSSSRLLAAAGRHERYRPCVCTGHPHSGC
nr:DUF6499 domain-containing protein [Pleomorphomonas carboxyditropha]